MPPTLTPQAFVAKWRGDARKERSVAQEHFIDLCHLLGHETPGDNRDGALVFEAGVSKIGGGEGWAPTVGRTITDEQIRERLLALNLERVAVQGGAAAMEVPEAEEA
jgi:hypothetical protein